MSINIYIAGYMAFSFFMTGLIWLVQLVHYPAYRYIDPAKFQEYQAFHTGHITYIVLPVMFIELLLVVLITYDNGLNESWFWPLQLVLTVLIWIWTFLINVPLHNKLSPSLVNKLILSNWPRTIIWTLKSFLILGTAL